MVPCCHQLGHEMVIGKDEHTTDQVLTLFYKYINETRTFEKHINLSSSLIDEKVIGAHPLAVYSGIDTCIASDW